jgi:hypothetical protein
MKKALPSQELLKEYLSYDPNSGKFTWIKQRPGIKLGRKAGAICGRYELIQFQGSNYTSHRLAWVYMTGEDPGHYEIDHKDGNSLNNKFCNLRKATRSQNSYNRPAKKNTATGLKGAYRHGDRFRAKIFYNGKQTHLGYFDTAEQAYKAYCDAAIKLHGDFANFG